MHASWNFRVDTLSVTMMLVVSGVGTLIHIYAIGYMHSDVRHNGDPAAYRRFFVYFNLFIAAMMILVCADNYLMLFVGWEGVGLCSYLLIGFWFEKGAGWHWQRPGRQEGLCGQPDRRFWPVDCAVLHVLELWHRSILTPSLPRQPWQLHRG